MPELPDITVYLDALERRILGHTLEKVTLVSPFLLRSVDPPLSSAFGARVGQLSRLGKRIVLAMDVPDPQNPKPSPRRYLVIHLMIAGRLHWHDKPPKLNRRLALAALVFDNGTLLLTEAGTKRRASLYVVGSAAGLQDHDRGGLEVMDATPAAFAQRLRSENHTLKRALTDPRLFSGIGNAYSDEILHRARLSPLQLTSRLTDAQIDQLFDATQGALRDWIHRLRLETGDRFPEKVTAFRKEMAVHGRYGEPCPVCGTKVQRIRYADNETNYCPTCQTAGKLLADRALSRLLKEDWPRSLDEMDELITAKSRDSAAPD